ncbi:uncharacterized protein LOC130857667 [Hippopotamus amphibius kiboko]|uniref:uncharacterized protein LOC130857667 n=1 Tax=Hippopotamus amphibius kiboko TaxID=575201 RepID=UPI002598BD9D|nr:uncharacterized protein LOC130857667 [Hippopotamus amphibius kiboko]
MDILRHIILSGDHAKALAPALRYERSSVDFSLELKALFYRQPSASPEFWVLSLGWGARESSTVLSSLHLEPLLLSSRHVLDNPNSSLPFQAHRQRRQAGSVWVPKSAKQCSTVPHQRESSWLSPTPLLISLRALNRPGQDLCWRLHVPRRKASYLVHVSRPGSEEFSCFESRLLRCDESCKRASGWPWRDTGIGCSCPYTPGFSRPSVYRLQLTSARHIFHIPLPQKQLRFFPSPRRKALRRPGPWCPEPPGVHLHSEVSLGLAGSPTPTPPPFSWRWTEEVRSPPRSARGFPSEHLGLGNPHKSPTSSA